MSQKKCPKCGEMNPPEAVMCWACYTPLTGGDAAAANAPQRGGPVVSEARGGMKKDIPPWQLGVVGLGVLVALGLGAKTFMASPSDDGGDTDVSAPEEKKPEANPAPAPAPAAAAVTPPPAPAITANPAASGTVPPPQKAPYSIISIPNPRYSWGTMAIVLTNPQASSTEAAAIAAYVRQKMMQNKKWLILHIYVFADREAGAQFRQYQRERRGAPLGAKDYRALAQIWPRAPVRYEYNRGGEGILLPSRNPGSWWTGRTIYTKVKQ